MDRTAEDQDLVVGSIYGNEQKTFCMLVLSRVRSQITYGEHSTT